MKRHRSGPRSVSPVCVICGWCLQIATRSRDGLNTVCDTVRRRSERLSLFFVSFDTVQIRSVSGQLCLSDTDGLFWSQMTLPYVRHCHILPLIQNTPCHLISSNPKPWNTSLITFSPPIQGPATRHQISTNLCGCISLVAFQIPNSYSKYWAAFCFYYCYRHFDFKLGRFITNILSVKEFDF